LIKFVFFSFFYLVPSRKQAFKLFNADESSQLLQVKEEKKKKREFIS
jgi:hypothetical protein